MQRFPKVQETNDDEDKDAPRELSRSANADWFERFEWVTRAYKSKPQELSRESRAELGLEIAQWACTPSDIRRANARSLAHPSAVCTVRPSDGKLLQAWHEQENETERQRGKQNSRMHACEVRNADCGVAGWASAGNGGAGRGRRGVR